MSKGLEIPKWVSRFKAWAGVGVYRSFYSLLRQPWLIIVFCSSLGQGQGSGGGLASMPWPRLSLP